MITPSADTHTDSFNILIVNIVPLSKCLQIKILWKLPNSLKLNKMTSNKHKTTEKFGKPILWLFFVALPRHGTCI